MGTPKLGIYWRKDEYENDPRLLSLIAELKGAGYSVFRTELSGSLPGGTQMLLSVGGDGTFLSAAEISYREGVPILGINFGRLGFLSENRAEGIAQILSRGEYKIEERTMLSASSESGPLAGNALNEISVHRAGAAMMGVDVNIDGMRLPTYWADGLLVATSSGSTAYSLSVGGPIVMPESKVLIISPIAPHNLNVRPLVVPETSRIELSFKSRGDKILLTMDNRTAAIDPSARIAISMAQFSLRRVRLNRSNFINALTGKLFWGEDMRNSSMNQSYEQ